MAGLIILIFALALGAYLYYDNKRRTRKNPTPSGTHQLLQENVTFYQNLSTNDKLAFESRIIDFLEHTSIRGVDVEIDDLDRVLVAAGAIILIFSFPDWKYNNISEVLLYKGTFSKDFKTEGGDRNVLGMVGDGALHHEMLLSKPSLRSSFKNPIDGHNTAIHEFAHLIDKADGATDGIPEYLLTRPEVLPWASEIHTAIQQIRNSNHSDIDSYGATNEAEFFAVISEYFFEKPDKLKEHHPELYAMLVKMFHPESSR